MLQQKWYYTFFLLLTMIEYRTNKQCLEKMTKWLLSNNNKQECIILTINNSMIAFMGSPHSTPLRCNLQNPNCLILRNSQFYSPNYKRKKLCPEAKLIQIKIQLFTKQFHLIEYRCHKVVKRQKISIKNTFFKQEQVSFCEARVVVKN